MCTTRGVGSPAASPPVVLPTDVNAVPGLTKHYRLLTQAKIAKIHLHYHVLLAPCRQALLTPSISLRQS